MVVARKIVATKLSDEERQLVEAAAKRDNRTLSDWIRLTILKAAAEQGGGK